MRLALISDEHFGPRAYHEGKLRKLTDQAALLTERFVERMNRIERPDLVINLGDVVEDANREQDLAEYRKFVSLLAKLEAKVVHVAGNHDQAYLSDDDLRALWGHTGELHYSLDFGGFRFIVLRTIETRDVAIHLPELQIEFARASLASSTLPAIVLMHHPASDQDLTGNRWFEARPYVCRVAERKALRRVFEESGKVRAVFNGHVHWNHLDVIRGIPYVTLQSLIENLDEDAPGRAAGAFAVCDLEPRGMTVTIHGEETARYQFDWTEARGG
jgi:3',5'-cyclic AMP phosphodiesterase CpdA